MNDRGASRDGESARSGLIAAQRQRSDLRNVLAGRIISIANLVRSPVLDAGGKRIGRVSDVVVRWDAKAVHPAVVSVLVVAGRVLGTIDSRDVVLAQDRIAIRTSAVLVAAAVRSAGDVALASDVLDHQLIDVAGVQVVRASDVYLVDVGRGWELAGVDVGTWALARRVLPRRRTCPTPDRSIDWADLQSFAPRFPDSDPSSHRNPASSAGTSGSAVQLATPAADLHKLRPDEVGKLLAGLDRNRQAQLVQLADSSAAAEVLHDLEPAKLKALLAELDDDDRAKLLRALAERNRS